MLFGQPSAALATFALATSARTVTTSPASLAAATLTATLSTAALGRPPPLHLRQALRRRPAKCEVLLADSLLIYGTRDRVMLHTYLLQRSALS